MGNIIDRLSLVNFRVHEDFHHQFGGCNLIIGDNGAGKTSVIEGIYLARYGRSFRKQKIGDIMRRGADFVRIGLEDDYNDYCVKYAPSREEFVSGKKKKITFKHEIVLMTPEIEYVFFASDSNRRDVFDRICEYFYKGHLSMINKAKYFLSQRMYVMNTSNDNILLNSYEKQIASLSVAISFTRSQCVAKINQFLEEMGTANLRLGCEISGQVLELGFTSAEEWYSRVLSQNRNHDKQVGYTCVGVNRASIGLDRQTKLESLSTGEKKRYLLEVMVCVCKALEKSGMRGLLMLDDFCIKLSQNNIDYVTGIVNSAGVQTFITSVTPIHGLKADVLRL